MSGIFTPGMLAAKAMAFSMALGDRDSSASPMAASSTCESTSTWQRTFTSMHLNETYTHSTSMNMDTHECTSSHLRCSLQRWGVRVDL